MITLWYGHKVRHFFQGSHDINVTFLVVLTLINLTLVKNVSARLHWYGFFHILNNNCKAYLWWMQPSKYFCLMVTYSSGGMYL
jgi:hypothetical protein